MKYSSDQMKNWPFYCEENIWHLCKKDSFRSFEKKVVFISNENRCFAMKNQRIGSLVYWDYHVVLLFKDNGWKVADFDTCLSFPCSVEEYLSTSFVPSVPPKFRVVDANHYIKYFASDRRHMIDQNRKYLQPPPPWNKIGSGFNLWDFVDGEHGQHYDLNEMYIEFGKEQDGGG